MLQTVGVDENDSLLTLMHPPEDKVRPETACLEEAYAMAHHIPQQVELLTRGIKPCLVGCDPDLQLFDKLKFAILKANGLNLDTVASRGQ